MRKTAQLGVLLSFTLILGYVESMIPFSFGIPGMKLGLANLGIVCTLYLWSDKEAICIDLLRIILTAFLFGNMTMMMYSLAGGMLSVIAMIIMKRFSCFSSTGVSMGGGVFHNIGQVCVAYFVVHTVGLLYYLPFLMISGLVTGFLIGIVHHAIHDRLRMIIRTGDI